MKKKERASFMKVFSDFILSDGMIDIREIEYLKILKTKYCIKKEDEILAASYSLSDALREISNTENNLKNGLIRDLIQIAMHGKNCTKEEALFIFAIQSYLVNNEENNILISSVKTYSGCFETSQILYIESEFEEEINKQVVEEYRSITTELRSVGFDFVYVPKVLEYYKSLSKDFVFQILSCLYPNIKIEYIETTLECLLSYSTDTFCKEYLYGEIRMRELSHIGPAILINFGNLPIERYCISSFMIIEITDNILKSVRNIFDKYTEVYYQIMGNLYPYPKETSNRFLLKGFYKQMFDSVIFRKGVQSIVVVDVYRERIFFPNVNAEIANIHRREKALYALFLVEIASGGINFAKPNSSKKLNRYRRRMLAIQEKYQLIYKMFGGEKEKAPKLEYSEIRLPMISLLKKEILKLNPVLYHAGDYTIQRNIYGNYSINIKPELCFCCGIDKKEIVHLSDSDIWQHISAL